MPTSGHRQKLCPDSCTKIPKKGRKKKRQKKVISRSQDSIELLLPPKWAPNNDNGTHKRRANDHLIRCGKKLASQMVSSFHSDTWKVDSRWYLKKCYKYCSSFSKYLWAREHQNTVINKQGLSMEAVENAGARVGGWRAGETTNFTSTFLGFFSWAWEWNWHKTGETYTNSNVLRETGTLIRKWSPKEEAKPTGLFSH